MSNYKTLQNEVKRFRNSRGWQQHDTPKNVIISLWVEVGELAEHFQYYSDSEILKILEDKKQEVAEELVDVLWWILLMANDFKFDLSQQFIRKMKKNLQKDIAKGYTQVSVAIPNKVESLLEMTDIINEFRKARGWHSQAHPRDLLLKMFEEVGELAQHVQWKTAAQFKAYLKENSDAVADELIDVLICTLLLFHHLHFDIEKEFARKVEKNTIKYPLLHAN